MDKEFIWNVFKNTGNVETYLEYTEYKKVCERRESENTGSDNKRD